MLICVIADNEYVASCESRCDDYTSLCGSRCDDYTSLCGSRGDDYTSLYVFSITSIIRHSAV